MSIYGDYREVLEKVAADFVAKIESDAEEVMKKTGVKPYEHLSSRIKNEKSMEAKCLEHGYPLDAHSALKLIHDSIGVRVVCLFIEDIWENIERIRHMTGVRVVREKDYIREAKANGYRSYHMIVEADSGVTDIDGNKPGKYFIEVQLRTIAMDTWAALEHEMRYKQDIRNPELIAEELRRCAGDLASCDVSMQTLRDLIRGKE